MWTDECEKTFQGLKAYLGLALVLAKLLMGERLFIYLHVFEHAVISMSIKEVAGIQTSVYHVSKRLFDIETRYCEVTYSSPRPERLDTTIWLTQ